MLGVISRCGDPWKGGAFDTNRDSDWLTCRTSNMHYRLGMRFCDTW